MYKRYSKYLKEKRDQTQKRSDVYYVETEGPNISNTWTDTTDSVFKEFKQNQKKQYEIFFEKSQRYGLDNITGGEDVDLSDPEIQKEILQSLFFRMRDKLNRFKNQIVDSSDPESMSDTLNDLSNYANIAKLVKDQKWHK